jgi:hypothetical protein
LEVLQDTELTQQLVLNLNAPQLEACEEFISIAIMINTDIQLRNQLTILHQKQFQLAA